jgi:class 3 adenylate cyclase/tetratricopeptide (TPR) repeat protein
MAGRVTSPVFVGRQQETALLEAALAGATGGEPRLVIVAGEAGVGKTRLVAEFLAGIQEAGLRVLAGGCLDLGQAGLPYAPLGEAIRRFAGSTDPEELERIVGVARPELARLVPELGEPAAGPEIETAPASQGEVAQARLFEHLLGFLDRAGRDQATVLVIEDVHWIDPASQALLTFLVRNLSRERLLIVATYRSDELGRGHPIATYLAELARSPRVERIALEPFTASELAVQLGGILGAPPAPSLLRAIEQRSEGNAFYAEELLAASSAGDVHSIPESLQEILLGRLMSLDEQARDVVRAAAVAGRGIDERLLAPVLELPERSVLAALREGVARHVLVADPTGGAFDFRHALLQEAVLADLLAGERRALHARFATILATQPELGDPSPAGASGELAHHWVAAERPREALAASVRAAQEAMTVFAFSQALQHCEDALGLWDSVPDEEREVGLDRIGLIMLAEEAANLAGDLDRAIELLRSGIALVDPHADPTRAGVLQGRLGYALWYTGHSDAALEAHRRAVELVPSEPATIERARVLRALGGALMGAGQYRDSVLVCEQAIACAREAGAALEEGRALNMLGSDLVELGEVEAGLARLEESKAIAEVEDPREGLVTALHNLAYQLGQADRLEDGLRYALEACDVAARTGLDRRLGGSIRGIAADLLYRVGRWAEARALVREGLALATDPIARIHLSAVKARLDAAQGREGEARSSLDMAGTVDDSQLEFDLVVYLRTAEAEVELLGGRPEHASAAVERAFAALAGREHTALALPVAAIGLRLEADAADAARAGRDEARLSAARSRGRALQERIGWSSERGPASPAGSDAVARLCGAESARLEGGIEPALWHEVASLFDATGEPYPGAYARYREAEAFLGMGHANARSDAGELLREAARVCRELGADPLGSQVAALARRARLEVGLEDREPVPVMADDRPYPTDLDRYGLATARERLGALGLSRREIEVLELVTSGRTNGQIARSLFISPKTAGVHVTHILDKLGVRNRVEAAMIAARLGLDGSRADGRVAEAAPGEQPRAEAAPVRRTFLFTDMVDSTRLVEAIGDGAWLDLRRWHDETLRQLFERANGEEVDHAGDGFFVAFPTAIAAVRCSISIQRALSEHRRRHGFAPQVRIGIHSAEARRAGAGYAGRGVHLAARVAAEAGPGEILVSEETLTEAGMRPIELRPIAAKGLAAPISVGRVDWQPDR